MRQKKLGLNAVLKWLKSNESYEFMETLYLDNACGWGDGWCGFLARSVRSVLGRSNSDLALIVRYYITDEYCTKVAIPDHVGVSFNAAEGFFDWRGVHKSKSLWLSSFKRSFSFDEHEFMSVCEDQDLIKYLLQGRDCDFLRKENVKLTNKIERIYCEGF